MGRKERSEITNKGRESVIKMDVYMDRESNTVSR